MVKRWEPWCTVTETYTEARPEDNGRFVDYSDYATLAAENERLTKERDDWQKTATEYASKLHTRRTEASAAVKVELSGITGELREAVAEAIRADGSDMDDTPWETLSDERKIGWLGDADRALAVVKDYLTTHAPAAPQEAEAVAWIGKRDLARLASGKAASVHASYHGSGDTALYISPPAQAVTEAQIDRVLDAAGDDMHVQYGNTALDHPTDRARIKAALTAAQEASHDAA